MAVVELAADSFGAPDWVMKMLITVLALGLPFAAFFAWAFELTPEGIKREKDVDRSQSITPVTGKKMDRGIIIALAIAVVFLLVDKFVLQDAPGVSEQQPTGQTSVEPQEAAEASRDLSIAVLPFVDMSEAGDSAYFADGLSEELLNLLAKIKELQVAGRTSSFAFKGQNQDLRIIGEQLSVENILEGSVRRVGDKVRVTAQLIDGKNGAHLWAAKYDRQLDDIFAVQDEIAERVVAALKLKPDFACASEGARVTFVSECSPIRRASRRSGGTAMGFAGLPRSNPTVRTARPLRQRCRPGLVRACTRAAASLTRH